MRAKKQLGQNFLINPKICSYIASLCAEHGRKFIEIGPGTGNLTSALLDSGCEVHAIEIDPRMKESLDIIRSDKFKYSIMDVLDYQFNQSDNICGNLPYNVGTRILLNAVQAKVSSMIFMLQKEVVQKISAKCNTGDYSSLSVLVQAYYNVKRGTIVRPGSFSPRPSVDSQIIIIHRKDCKLGCTVKRADDAKIKQGNKLDLDQVSVKTNALESMSQIYVKNKINHNNEELKGISSKSGDLIENNIKNININSQNICKISNSQAHCMTICNATDNGVRNATDNIGCNAIANAANNHNEITQQSVNCCPFVSYTKLSAVLRVAFSANRKMVRNTLCKKWPHLSNYIDPKVRPNEIAIEQYVHIARMLD